MVGRQKSLQIPLFTYYFFLEEENRTAHIEEEVVVTNENGENDEKADIHCLKIEL